MNGVAEPRSTDRVPGREGVPIAGECDGGVDFPRETDCALVEPLGSGWTSPAGAALGRAD